MEESSVWLIIGAVIVMFYVVSYLYSAIKESKQVPSLKVRIGNLEVENQRQKDELSKTVKELSQKGQELEELHIKNDAMSRELLQNRADTRRQKAEYLQWREEKLQSPELEARVLQDYIGLSEKVGTPFECVARIMADYYLVDIKKTEKKLGVSKKTYERERSYKIREIYDETHQILEQERLALYKLMHIVYSSPSLLNELQNNGKLCQILNSTPGLKEINRRELVLRVREAELDRKAAMLEESIQEHLEKEQAWETAIKMKVDAVQGYVNNSKSNLQILPFMAKLMADIQTIDIESLAKALENGNSKKQEEKAVKIKQIRKEVQQRLERYKMAEYQLEYLKQLYPVLDDVLESEYSELPDSVTREIPDYDVAKDYLSKEEWAELTETERNQRALDRYCQGHNKTKWQIGRDYELFVGYECMQAGYEVDYFGSNMGLEDLGRDIIAKKDNKILIIQCKYWSEQKVIHEKHIAQLYGTTMCYCMERETQQTFFQKDIVQAVLITNITVSDTARKFAEYLGVKVIENHAMGQFPRIKCNIGKGEDGQPTQIYHLPFDQQYDNVKINQPGEKFAYTIKEAEDAGFRRAYRWHS